MPNHVHALIGFRRTDQGINTIVGNGKRFIAYEIVKRLEKQKQTKLLQQLQQAVEITDKLRNKRHEIWEDSFDWKECTSEKFIKQKLDYMHNNPCKGKWNLVNNSCHTTCIVPQGFIFVVRTVIIKSQTMLSYLILI